MSKGIDFGAAWPPPAALASAAEGRLFTLSPAAGAGAPARATPTGILRAVLLGAGFGLGWGIVFRLFMRLISDDPQFTVAGTAFILTYSTLVWGLTGLQIAWRRRGWSWWRRTAPSLVVVTLLAFMTIFGPTLPLFVLALWLGVMRRRWPAGLRLALVGLSAVVFVGSWCAVFVLDPAFDTISAGTVLQGLGGVVVSLAVFVPLPFALAWAVEPLTAAERRRSLPVAAPSTDAEIAHLQTATV
jgi:hypothetical protein